MSTGSMQRGFFTRVADHVRQLICGMHGHDSLLHFERGRMSLLCSSCGYESPGWELKGNARPQAAQSLPERLGGVPWKRPRVLMGERRVA